MLIGNRFARNIVFMFGTLVLLILLVHYIMPKSAIAILGGDTEVTEQIRTFKGFNWFFNKINSFPGFSTLFKVMVQWTESIQWNEPVGDTIWTAVGLDYVINVLKLLITPLVFVGTAVWCIGENLIWLLGFFKFW